MNHCKYQDYSLQTTHLLNTTNKLRFWVYHSYCMQWHQQHAVWGVGGEGEGRKGGVEGMRNVYTESETASTVEENSTPPILALLHWAHTDTHNLCDHTDMVSHTRGNYPNLLIPGHLYFQPYLKDIAVWDAHCENPKHCWNKGQVRPQWCKQWPSLLHAGTTSVPTNALTISESVKTTQARCGGEAMWGRGPGKWVAGECLLWGRKVAQQSHSPCITHSINAEIRAIQLHSVTTINRWLL